MISRGGQSSIDGGITLLRRTTTTQRSSIAALLLVLTLCLIGLFRQRNTIHDYDFVSSQWSTNKSQLSTIVSEEDISGRWIYLNASEKVEASEFCQYRWDFTKPALDLIELQPTNATQRQSILCYVHTISSFQEKSQAIRDTWGHTCDRLIFISNETWTDTVNIPLIAYDHANLWDKSRKSFQYLYRHYPNYDWYYKADDDTYIIMQNLRAFLAKQSIDEPLLFGHRFMLPDGIAAAVLGRLYPDFTREFGPVIYISGGSGYALNNKLLKNMVRHLDRPYCFPNRTTVPEDVATGVCGRYAGGYAPETRDRMHKQRFHPLNPSTTLRQNVLFGRDSWWYNYHEGTGGVQGGQLAISKESVSFHYCKPDLMYYIDSRLYACQAYLNQTVPVWFRDLLIDSEWMKKYDPLGYAKKKELESAAAKTEDDEEREIFNNTISNSPAAATATAAVAAVEFPLSLQPESKSPEQ